MSVRIAVNGKEYGPYERPALVEMVSNGALTPNTLVFMNGMTEWKPAREVEDVNSLFGRREPVPSAPPIPWADAPRAKSASPVETKAADTANDNSFSPKLNSLITAAVADGEISDFERQVLIRNAQAENVPMDEFVMVLEARLYEQRQVLLAQQKQREHQENLVSAQIEATKNTARAESTTNDAAKSKKDRKCPACGAMIASSVESRCPDCGYELDIEQTESPIQPLMDKLDKIDREMQSMNPINLAMGGQATAYQRKVQAISSFIVPSTRRAIMEFFMVACSSTNASTFFGDPLKKAWKQKVREVMERAKLMYGDDEEFQASLRSTAKNFKIKV